MICVLVNIWQSVCSGFDWQVKELRATDLFWMQVDLVPKGEHDAGLIEDVRHFCGVFVVGGHSDSATKLQKLLEADCIAWIVTEAFLE